MSHTPALLRHSAIQDGVMPLLCRYYYIHRSIVDVASGCLVTTIWLMLILIAMPDTPPRWYAIHDDAIDEPLPRLLFFWRTMPRRLRCRFVDAASVIE